IISHRLNTKEIDDLIFLVLKSVDIPARANTKVKGDFCYYLGSVKFPYTDIPLSNEDTKWEG
ncbi:hypothetical protein ACFX2V_09390, partial [Gilliamella apicola]|uniref:hypothetical protein n=1 Tax=Gilliamella apicola TaxID=1196095 RepID=UPI0039860406